MLEKWKILKSKITYHDRWLKVRSDTCETSSGQIVEPYHVIEQPSWVNVVALTPELNICLIQQYRHGIQKIVTELPCGVVEQDDDGPMAAMKRELEEETGCSSDDFFATGVSYANPANQDNLVYSFLAINAHKERDQKLDQNEAIEVVEIPLLDFLKMTNEKSILEPTQALHLACVYFFINFVLSSTDPKLSSVQEKLGEFFAKK